MGFVPLAFRAAGRSTIEKVRRQTGSTAGATHIFWQKRIRSGDTRTPWWYPYETTGGSMMEGRIVLPLPPEMGWQDAAPVVLPGAERREQEQRLLEAKVSEAEKRERAAKKRGTRKGQREDGRVEEPAAAAVAPRVVGAGGFGVDCGFGQPAPGSAPAPRNVAELPGEAELARVEAEKAAAKQALREAQRRNDPELVAYARELRDRWQEHVTGDGTHAGMIEAKARPRYLLHRPAEIFTPDPSRTDPAEVEAIPNTETPTPADTKRLAA